MSAVLNSNFLMQILGANDEKELFAKLDIEHERYIHDGLSLDIIDEIIYFCNERIINLNYVFISKERR